jgi:predicted peptidase
VQLKQLVLAMLIGLIYGSFSDCLAQALAVKPPTASQHYERKEFVSRDGTKLSYWLMTPEQTEDGKTYPLVLALHGRGGNTQAATVLGTDEMRKKYPCLVVAPAVSRAAVWSLPKGFQKLRGAQRLPVVLEALDAVLKEHPVDPDRVYVTGQSMGGFGTFGAISVSPQMFAAAVPVCGGWDPADAVKIKNVPLWAFHGEADGTVPAERSRSMVDAVKEAGGSPKYTEYPGVGHNSWSKAYASPLTWEWLFAQRRAD